MTFSQTAVAIGAGSGKLSDCLKANGSLWKHAFQAEGVASDSIRASSVVRLEPGLG